MIGTAGLREMAPHCGIGVLFVTGLSPQNGGGSWRSTLELARSLRGRGHGVGILCGSRRSTETPLFYKRAVNLATKLGGTGSGDLAWGVAHQPGRLGRTREAEGFPVLVSPVPENALPAALRAARPDIVVASSLLRPAWRRVHQVARATGIPVALYLREDVALGHLSDPGALPDLILSNAETHGRAAEALGHSVAVVPSVVDTGATATTSTRERVLFVNPIESRGVEVAFTLAAACAHLPFAFLESWPLDRATWAELGRRVSELPNVELRRRHGDRRDVYADARVLLVPYRVPNRPRVVLEAQANGIPVLGTALGGIAEAIGPGGLTVGVDAPIEAWISALERLWADAENARFAAAALQHARRSEASADSVTARVERALLDVIS